MPAGTLKVALPEPVLPVTIIPISSVIVGSTKFTNTFASAGNPFAVTVTEEPAAPEEALNNALCAFTNGVTITTNVNTLRKSTASIALPNLFFILITWFAN